MKKQILKALTMASLILLCSLAAATTASAQAQERSRYAASIPFAFQIGNRTLPAGQYTIEYNSTPNGQVILRLTSEDEESATRLTHSVETRAPRARTVLVFNRYGEQRFLAQMWRAGDVRGRQLYKSGQELVLERGLAEQRRQKQLAKREATTTIELTALAQ